MVTAISPVTYERALTRNRLPRSNAVILEPPVFSKEKPYCVIFGRGTTVLETVEEDLANIEGIAWREWLGTGDRDLVGRFFRADQLPSDLIRNSPHQLKYSIFSADGLSGLRNAEFLNFLYAVAFTVQRSLYKRRR